MSGPPRRPAALLAVVAVLVAGGLCALAAATGTTRPARAVAAPPATTTTAAPPARGAVRVVAPTGTDGPGGCVAAAPCATLAAALRAAAPGDRVELAAGAYGPQEVPADVDRAPTGVVVAPAPGAEVSFAGLELRGGGVELRDLATQGFAARPGSHDLTLRRVDVRGAFFITSARRVRLLSSRVGPGDSVDPQIKAADTEGAPVPADIAIDRTTFHDFTRREDPSAHVECLQVGAVDGLRITRSTFTRCATQDVLVKAFGGTATIDDVTIEGNVLDRSLEGFHALRISANGRRYRDVRVAYNSALQSLVADADAAIALRWVGNIAPRQASDCARTQAFSHDVWQGARCSRSDRDARAGFVDPARLDLRLRPGAPGLGRGDPRDPPRSAIRPAGAARRDAPDAGAFQR